MINLCFKDDKPSIVTLEYQFMQRHKCFNIFQTSSPIHLPSLPQTPPLLKFSSSEKPNVLEKMIT